MSQWALTFCPNAASAAAFQQEQLQRAVRPMCNLGRWTCCFPSLLLNMRRATGAWSPFWESLPRLALPWLDEGTSQSAADALLGAVSQPSWVSVLLRWSAHGEGSIWCVHGIPAQPLPPRCRAQSQEVVVGRGWSAGDGSMPGRQRYPACAPWATIHRSWLPSASSSSWPNVLSSFCLFCSNSFLANTILRVVLILIDEAGAQSCLGMVRHYLSRKINSHVHSSSFQKMEK